MGMMENKAQNKKQTKNYKQTNPPKHTHKIKKIKKTHQKSHTSFSVDKHLLHLPTEVTLRFPNQFD